MVKLISIQITNNEHIYNIEKKNKYFLHFIFNK